MPHNSPFDFILVESGKTYANFYNTVKTFCILNHEFIHECEPGILIFPHSPTSATVESLSPANGLLMNSLNVFPFPGLFFRNNVFFDHLQAK